MPFKRNVFLALLNFLAIAATQDMEPSIPMDISSTNNNLIEITDQIDPFQENIENVPYDFLLSWQARRSLRRILAQMPCGWPEYNIPPLAPYINDNFTFQIQNEFTSSENSFNPLRIDGLDLMDIYRLTVGVIFKRIQFDFNFSNITISGNFDTSTIIDMEHLMGIKLAANGNGKLLLTLENLRIAGSFKYKMPVSLGSAKIFKTDIQVSVGNVRSEIEGVINGIPISSELNDLIVNKMLTNLNDHDYLWNALLEGRILPIINDNLEGKTLWKLLLWSMQRDAVTCSDHTDFDKIQIEELHQLLLKEQI